MNAAALKAELDDLAGPLRSAYVSAGWDDPLPTMVGNPSVGVPYTAEDNAARYVQAEKYQAIANVLNNSTLRQLPAVDITDEQFLSSIDKSEFDSLTAKMRQFVEMHQRVGSSRQWRKAMRVELAANGASRIAMRSFKMSRSKEISSQLGGQRVRAGLVKSARGDIQ